ncbi:MAG TPA: trigger factor [Armatimonadota bacterium]|nr:trigger factor [Armatimonadota bacterium]
MQLVTRETLEDGRVRIIVKAEAEEVSRAVDGIYRDLARRASVPGFRKGKAPRALLEQQVGIEQARRSALDELAPAAVTEGIGQADVEPYSRPELEAAKVEDDASATFIALVTPRPKVELGEYRGLTAVRPAVEVSDEQVEAQLTAVRERHARYEPASDRAAEEGDLALVDYDLEIAGQAVEGQGARGYPCQIGSDNLFPELNERLVGLQPGGQVRITATFPADHREAALAGKQGEYVVTVRELRQRVVPELTDEMAQAAHGVATASELRERMREALTRLAEEDGEDRLHMELLEQIVASTAMTLPPAMVRAEAQAQLRRLEERLRADGINPERYLAERGTDAERWLREQEMQARVHLKRALVLEEIGRREGIEVSSAEVSDEIAGMARRAGTSVERVLKRLHDRDVVRLANRVHHHKVLQFLVDHADITSEGEAATAAESREEES